MDEFIVYVQTNEQGVIVAINSSAFVDGAGWIEVDRGYGDKYSHAQGHYLSDTLLDEDGIFNFKYADGEIKERTEEEKQADREAMAEEQSNRLATAEEIGRAILDAYNSR